MTSAHVHKASPSDTHPRPLTKATAKKDVEKRTYSEGRSGPFVCTGRFRPEARSVARGTFAGVSRGIKKEVEEVEITKTWVVGGAFGGVARSVKKEATERARIGTVPEKCRRFQSTGQVSGKEYEPTGEAVTVRMPQKVVRVGTGETEGSSAHIDSGKEARGIERVEVSKRGQAGEGVCSKEKRVVTLQELLKGEAGCASCSLMISKPFLRPSFN